MKHIILNLSLFSSFVFLASCQQNERYEDSKFILKAADAGMLEVKLGKLAAGHASSNKIRALGKHMASDHSKANAELLALAEEKRLKLPTLLSEKSTHIYDSLATKKGAEFDQEYAALMVKDHKKVIEEFKEEAAYGKDPELKEWASQKIPVLEHHLQMSESSLEGLEAMK